MTPVSCRVTDDEKMILTARAEKAGLNLSEYLKVIIFNAEKQEKDGLKNLRQDISEIKETVMILREIRNYAFRAYVVSFNHFAEGASEEAVNHLRKRLGEEVTDMEEKTRRKENEK